MLPAASTSLATTSCGRGRHSLRPTLVEGFGKSRLPAWRFARDSAASRRVEFMCQIRGKTCGDMALRTMTVCKGSGVGQGSLGQPWVGQPWAGQPWAGQPWAGQPWAGQPWAGQPWAGQPWAGQTRCRGSPAYRSIAVHVPPELPASAPMFLKGLSISMGDEPSHKATTQTDRE